MLCVMGIIQCIFVLCYPAQCRSEYRCKSCKGRHNTVLHEAAPSVSNNNVNSQVNAVDAVVTVAGHSDHKVPSSLLMTSQVLLTGPSGKSMVARALLDSEVYLEVVAAVVTEVTGTLPLQGAKSALELPHIKGLQLADPHFYSPGKIDLLLGENVLDKILLPHSQSGPPGTPSAWNTIFGWSVRGAIYS